MKYRGYWAKIRRARIQEEYYHWGACRSVHSAASHCRCSSKIKYKYGMHTIDLIKTHLGPAYRTAPYSTFNNARQNLGRHTISEPCSMLLVAQSTNHLCHCPIPLLCDRVYKLTLEMVNRKVVLLNDCFPVRSLPYQIASSQLSCEILRKPAHCHRLEFLTIVNW